MSRAGHLWGLGKGLHGEEQSRVETDPRAEVPLAGLSCPANAAGSNVTSVSLAVNPGAPQLVLIWIFRDQREQVDSVGARWLLFQPLGIGG